MKVFVRLRAHEHFRTTGYSSRRGTGGASVGDEDQTTNGLLGGGGGRSSGA